MAIVIPEWTEQALCVEVDPEIFYPERGGSDSVHAAKKICGLCVVQPACLAHALETDEQWGVWGGYTERARRKMRRSS